MGEAQAHTTVRHGAESVAITTTSGHTRYYGTDFEIRVTYVPGDEDTAIDDLRHAVEQIIGKISAARPASASTEKEGHTTP